MYDFCDFFDVTDKATNGLRIMLHPSSLPTADPCGLRHKNYASIRHVLTIFHLLVMNSTQLNVSAVVLTLFT